MDYAVVMSVNPGWGGQPFLEPSIDKVRRLKREATEAGSALAIEVDGGVGEANAARLAAAGAEILVAGTAVYGAADPAAAIEKLRRCAAAPAGAPVAR
jgi:ribulose-phosphate 3-epimerase